MVWLVAPHTGAWIEIHRKILHSPALYVAPHTGAWIEMYNARNVNLDGTVAPHTGAWIEISLVFPAVFCIVSHPTRVRGLKLHGTCYLHRLSTSHPTRVRGLKYNIRHKHGFLLGRTPHGCVD